MKEICNNVYQTTNSQIKNHRAKEILKNSQRATVYVHSYQADNLMFVISIDGDKVEVQNNKYETIEDIPYYIQDFYEQR